jgi:Tn7-like transposition protein D
LKKSKQSEKKSKYSGYIDWKKRDEKIALLVRETAELMTNLTARPRYITKTAIGREANCLSLLLSKLHKLPKTAKTINSVVDTGITFAIKKIYWVVIVTNKVVT